MEFDFSVAIVSPSVIVYPDVAFPDQPLNPNDLKTRVYLTGTEAGQNSIVTGTIEVRH